MELNKSHIGRRVRNRFGNEGVISDILNVSGHYPIRVSLDNGSIRYYTIDGKDFKCDDFASITLIEENKRNK